MTHETPMSDNPVSHDELIRTVDKFNFSIEALMKEEGSLSQQACVDEAGVLVHEFIMALVRIVNETQTHEA